MEFLAGLHPKVVHFPVALFITYIVLEATGVIFKKEFFLKAAHLILLLGVIGAFFAVLTGNQAFSNYEQWTDASKALFLEHQNFANLSVWYFTALLVARTYFVLKKKFSLRLKYIILIASLFGGYLVYQTAEHGGELVYKYGVGTELNIKQVPDDQ